MTETSDGLEKVFLYDTSIVDWEKPLVAGQHTLASRPNGYTQIIRPAGIRNITAGSAGDFIVYASAAVYFAEVTRSDGGIVVLEAGKNWKDLVKGTPERMALFSGGIEIYERGVPGVTEKSETSRGFHLRRNGIIWYAQTSSEPELDKVVFGSSMRDEDRAERIERILRGYDHQEAVRRERILSACDESWESGRFSLLDR
jgi:hypothetical protein